MEKSQPKLPLILKGMAMGIAEVIPGVSGGTIAFITGIYETLLDSIKKVLGPELIASFRRGGLRETWTSIHGGFLLFLIGGMAIGFVAGVFGVDHLLERYPVLVWSFFFGLIIASAIYIGRQVRKWGWEAILGLILAVALAFWITIATPAQGSDSLLMVFIAGSIAISALILPGISGSFMLLLMGMYTVIFPEIKNALTTFDTRSLLVVAVFGLGCLVGLGTISRLLSWTFKRFHNTTLAVLTGFMIGSLNKIWPWRNVLSTRIDSGGEEVPFLEKSVLPAQYDGEPMVVMALLMIAIGFASVFFIDWLGRRAQP